MATGKNLQSKALAAQKRAFCTYGAMFLAPLVAGHALAVDRELKIEPSVTLRGEFRDREAVQEAAKWVAEVDPTLAVRFASGDSSLNLRYSPRLFVTDLANERSDVVHSLAAQGLWSLAAKRLQVGANALIGEQARDPLSPLLSTTIPSGERIRNFSAGVNAVARDNVAFGMLAEIRGNYQFSDAAIVNATTTGNVTPRSHRWTVATDLKPTTRRPPFGWLAGAQYSRRTVDGSDNEGESYKGFLGADWNPSSQLGFGARVGYEQADFVTNGQELRGAYVDATAQWRPNARMEGTALIGAHYYGLGYELNFKWRESRAAMEFTARRAVATAQESIFIPQTDSPLGLLDRYLTGSITDPTLRAQEVQRLSSVLGIPNSLPDGRFFYVDRSVLEEFARASIVYSLPRLTLNAFAQFRDIKPSASEVGALRADVVRPLSEWLVGVGGAYRVSQRWTVRSDTTAERVRSKSDDKRLNRIRSQIALTQQWSRAITTGATVFYDRAKSDSIASDFDDRGLAVFVRYQFN